MLFHTFDGKLMLVLHHPRRRFTLSYDMRDTGETIIVDHEWK